jgi:hypothetical protein
VEADLEILILMAAGLRNPAERREKSYKKEQAAAESCRLSFEIERNLPQ